MRESYLTNAEGKRADNYELTCEKWRNIFLEMDQEKLAERFGLESDGEALYITYYAQKYRIDRRNGMITLADYPEQKLAFNTLMSIYNLFYYAKPGAAVKGEFVPFRQVKRAAPFDPAFQRTVLKPLAKTFEGRMELLEKACTALHGSPVRQGDVGYVIKAFDCMPLTMIFWDGDEEFEAQANILFDADITDFIHEESVVCVASDLVRRLSEEAGVKEAGQLMGNDIRRK
ncbi:MAG: DUF3786 domain-containing protein [Eubacteriales bacterium]|nr:DUF3786 domain-containing protein [Eubacteriales bacterium]